MEQLLNPKVSANTVLLTNLACRQRRSLDGTWRAIIDPYDTGYVNILGQRNKLGYFRDLKPRTPSDRVEYDFDRSLELVVPGDWNTQDPSLLYYEGTVWYRTLFDVDRAESARTFLSFGAANHTTRVFLDGEELATHVGGFGPFAVEVTGRLALGSHSLVVQVNNRREPDRIPGMRSDWWNFGGITRSVELVSVPRTFLRDAWLTMAPDGRIIGGATIDGADSATLNDPPCTVDLIDAGITAELVDGGVEIDAVTASRLERWSPGAPVLHRIRWACGQDVIDDEVGFRTVKVEGNRVFVNDEETFLRGISIHGEGPSGGKRAHGPDDASTLLSWAEDLGANFVRLAHYQHDEHMVREADRRGLLAWTELPVYWNIAFGSEAVMANAVAQADELVIRDRSRASVILWSVANETLPDDARLSFLSTLVQRVKVLDSTRLTTAALLTIPSKDPVVHIEDPLGEVVDVIAINQYLGWYYGQRLEIASTTFSTAFAKPIIFSEFGAGAKHGNHGTDEEIWTEEFQAAVYNEQISMIRNQADCVGLSPWILKDFRTPLRVLPEIQDGYNRKGLVSEEGERKLAFDVLR
ncbi:MAG: beta-glucuronidase, partial [Actinomycetia bacterium]|nr:beta-glucuronidase [Actinomycetes bacterium]